jgi:hypothetical protein
MLTRLCIWVGGHGRADRVDLDDPLPAGHVLGSVRRQQFE